MTGDIARWKSLDAASYDDVAPEFDAFSRRLALPVAKHLVSLAALRAGERALDVGTGTGMIPLEAARVAPEATLVGVDISSGMIAQARHAAAQQGLPESRVSFRQMDAEDLALGDGEFDAVMSAFALGHIPRPERAIAEMFRVLRPGGRLLLTVGSRPPLVSLDAALHAFAEVARRVQAVRGRRQSSDLLDRIVDRHLAPAKNEPSGSPLATQLSRGAPVAALARAAGFSKLRISWRNYQNGVESVAEFWDMQRTICTGARKRLMNATPQMVANVRAEFVATAEATLARRGTLVFPISAVFVTAVKPRARGASGG